MPPGIENVKPRAKIWTPGLAGTLATPSTAGKPVTAGPPATACSKGTAETPWQLGYTRNLSNSRETSKRKPSGT